MVWTLRSFNTANTEATAPSLSFVKSTRPSTSLQFKDILDNSFIPECVPPCNYTLAGERAAGLANLVEPLPGPTGNKILIKGLWSVHITNFAPHNYCSRLSDIAGTGGAESGTASRFSLENAVPPGRHDNGDADTSTGNPDIRVPEEIEGEDGLPAGDAKRSEDADGGAERRDAGPGDPGKRPKNEEIQETSDQGRLETQGRPEGREIRHVAAPGGAQLMPAKSPGTWKTPLEDQERTPAEASRAQEGPVAGPGS
ncbi:uncharacterized protein [Pleurodeles waltl]|uniref:uncharacterized protein n=1 Tax=Pleurodeles waltl TaxID=8319 RepID=UPI003709A5F3